METLLPRSILNAVTAAVAPAAVYQLGHTVSTKEYKHIFSRQVITATQPAAFQLLVLTGTTGISLCNIQDRVEAFSNERCSISCLAMNTTAFNNMLLQYEHFAVQTVTYGKCLYQSPGTVFSEAKAGNKTVIKVDHTPWLARANSFLAGAQLYLLRKDYRLAAFMLHQAAEQALTAIILHATGYYPKLHNIAKLYRYALPYAEGLHHLFIDDQLSFKNALDELQKAYAGSRYDEAYRCKATLLESLHIQLEMFYRLAAGLINQEELALQ